MKKKKRKKWRTGSRASDTVNVDSQAQPWVEPRSPRYLSVQPLHPHNQVQEKKKKTEKKKGLQACTLHTDDSSQHRVESKPILQLSTVQTMYRLPLSFPTRPKQTHEMVDNCKMFFNLLLAGNNFFKTHQLFNFIKSRKIRAQHKPKGKMAR